MVSHSKPKLIYFDITGRAESIRMAFHFGDIDFEDKRITRDEFMTMKQGFPFGHLPVMEIDGEYISQSMALLYYAGVRAKLLPADDVMKTKVMEFIFGLEDLINLIGPSLRESDPQKKSEMRKLLASETIPYFLEKLDKLSRKNGKGSICVGDTLTIADIITYNIMGWLKSSFLDDIPIDIGDKYSKLMQVHTAIFNHPKTKSWNERVA